MLTDTERETVFQTAVRQLSEYRAAMERSFETWGEQARQQWYQKHDAALWAAWKDFQTKDAPRPRVTVAPWGCHD